jgi:3-oxoadipate enol-lactonase
LPVIERDGIRISFDDKGSGSPVVLTHSYFCSGEMWRELVPQLVEAYRVVNVDLRGHGKSSAIGAPFSLYDLVDDIVRVLDSLDIERAAWAGLSVGGMVSMRAALTVPDRVAGLLLLDTHAGVETRMRRVKYAAMRTIARQFGLGAVLPAISRLMFGPTTRRMNRQLVSEWEEKFRSADLMSMLLYARCLVNRDSIVSRLGEVSVPALVIVGEEDAALPVYCAEEIAAGLPDARLVVVPEAGHLSALEQPTIIADEMCRFLRALK